MTALELWRSESLNKLEQKAFSELADTIIFSTPQQFKLSRGSIKQLSRLLQQEFLEQDEAHESEKIKQVHEMIGRIHTGAVALIKKRNEQDPPQQAEEPSDDLTIVSEEVIPAEEPAVPHEERSATVEEFIKKTEGYVAMRHLDDSNGYNGWGFTPKLAGMRTKDSGFDFGIDGKNCFGVVQGLGAIYNKMGLQFEMGITADHPFAIVQLEGVTYLASLHGVAQAKGTFEIKDGYKIYMPSKDDDIRYSLMIVWDFDEAVVYELLENLEVLRQMSLGNEVENLPNTAERGSQLATEYKNLLQATSWRTLQHKLLPRLAKYFDDTSDAWKVELDRIGSAREIEAFFKEVMTAGQAATSMKNLTFDEFKKQFLPLAKEYRASITTIFSGSVPEVGTPEDVTSFARRAKEILDAIEVPKFRDAVTHAFLKPFIGQDAALTEE